MKQNTINKIDTIMVSAKPLDQFACAVLVTHIIADDLGPSYVVHDAEHLVEKTGTSLYSLEDFEPHALISPEYGVVFIAGESGRTFAYDWNSKASRIPAEIAKLVENSDKLSDAEVAEVFVEDVLPHLNEDDDECVTMDFDLIEEVKSMLYI